AGYGLTFAIGMITGGRLGDIYGRRRMFALGLALFTLTSAACGLAPNAGVLVAARMLQGAAGALLTPQGLAILGMTYDGGQRGRAVAGRAPLVDLTLFRLRTFAVGSLTAMTFSLVPPSLFFVLALYLQQGRGYSALFSGTVFVAVGVGYFAALVVAVPLAARLGHQVLALGALLVAIGCVVLAEAAHAPSAWELTPGLALAGFGIGA